MRLSIIYTTDNNLPFSVKMFCLTRLKQQAKKGKHQLIEIRQAPEAPRCHLSIYKNLMTGLELAVNKYVAIAEHDCIYSDDYFDSIKNDEISYSKNVTYLTPDGFAKREIPFAPLSTLAGEKTAIAHEVRKKIIEGEGVKWAEPGIEKAKFRKTGWTIDVRHGGNFTGGREKFIKSYQETFETFNANNLWGELMPRKAKVKPKKTTGVTCIITSRVEKYLKWTVENVQRTAPGAEIIVVHDGWTDNILNMPGVIEYVPWVTPQGVGQSRHYGMTKAFNDICVFLDAHMDFSDGWLEKVCEPVMKDIKSIACSRSAVLREDRMNMDNPEKIQGGATIQFDSYIPFDPLWVESRTGEIQCILGACYAVSRNHYTNCLLYTSDAADE